MGLMAPMGLMAQKVYKSSGRVILDMTETGEGTGMPAGAVTATSKTAVYNSYTASNTAWLINTTDNLVGSGINAAVYRKLEIAPMDMAGTSDTAPMLAATGVDLSWASSFNRCKNLEYPAAGDKGSWRLPTQRELLLMIIMAPAIESFSGVTAFNAGRYWAATEVNEYSVWCLSFASTDTSGSNAKAEAYRTRCVREL